MAHFTADFNARASTYDTATPIQTQVAQQLAERIKHFQTQNFQRIKKPKPLIWLDLGCGTGKLSQAVLGKLDNLDKLDNLNGEKSLSLSQGLQLYGIDNAENMRQVYEKNLANFQPTGLKPTFFPLTVSSQQADIAEFQRDFLPHSVDMLMSSFALHWVTPDCVRNWTNLLTSSGQIHVAIPVLGSLSAVHARYPKLPIYVFPPAQDWQNALLALLSKEGGRVLYQEIRTFEHAYPNLQALLSALKTMGGTVRFNRCENSLDAITLRHYLKDNQPIALDYRVLLLGLEVA